LKVGLIVQHIKNFIIGIIIGTGLILPGVSGAVLAIALNVYDKLLKVFSNIFIDFKKNIIFLTPILLGIAFGTVAFGNLLLYFFDNYPIQTKTAMIGLVVGSLPIVFNKIKTKNNKYEFKMVSFFVALLLGISLYIINDSYIVNQSVEMFDNGIDSIIMLFIGGFVFSLGKIVPGISSSFMLMALGMYQYILYLIANPILAVTNQFINLSIFVTGFLFGTIMLSKLILILLNKQQYHSYSAIIGFIVGSLLIIWPKYSLNIETLLSFLIFVIMFSLSYGFSLYENNKKH
jgi:putative membrane protein